MGHTVASLADRLKQTQPGTTVRGPGGQLAQETPEGIQSLSDKAGLQAPPLTPMGQAGIGATPDQQKMAGTPNQKAASLAQSLNTAPQNQLDTAQRQQQVRTQQTGQEAAQAQKSVDMQNLGQLGTRVTSFIETQRQKLEAATQAAVPVEQKLAENIQAGESGNIEQLKSDLVAFRSNPNDPSLLARINKNLGRDLNTYLKPEEIDSLYESTVDAISKGTAGNVDDDLNVDDLVNQGDLGYSKEELAGLLGLPVDQVGTLTVAQLRDQIAKTADVEFSSTAALETKAGSGQLGQAERGLARSAAQEASQTGMRSSEADVAHLEQQIQNADEVQFGGRSYKVDDLLKDETISGIVSEYLNSAPDSEVRRRIDQSEPALRDFITKNQALLADASKQMQSGTKAFGEIQEYNKGLSSSLFGGHKIDDSIMKALVPNIDQIQEAKVDPSTSGLLKYVSGLNKDQAGLIADNLNANLRDNPQIVNQLQGLTPQQWGDLGIGQSNSKWSKYVNKVKDAVDIRNMDLSNPDTAIQQLYSDVGSVAEANERQAISRAQYLLGFPSGSINADVSDSNRDGVIDDKDNLAQTVVNRNQMPSIQDALNGVWRPGKQAMGQVGQNNATQMELVNKLKPYTADGKLEEGELSQVASSLSDEQLETVAKSPAGQMSGANFLLASRIKSNTAGEIQKSADEKLGPQQWIDKINQLLATPNAKFLDKQLLEAQKSNAQNILEGQERDKQAALDKSLADTLKMFSGGLSGGGFHGMGI